MLILYQRETCPYCKPVRERLTELQITYINVNLPRERAERVALIEKMGVPFIPAIEDEGVLIPGKLEDNAHILSYINEHYCKQKDVNKV
ncbi:glutaredoxin domain-containing protein [Paenibacillus silvae]|uniref:glutaredoxin domain-containing protein n=1 Tax=Paenibacillus silvae TaxID=1325358 RepID=UPI0011AA0070|nr:MULTISPECIES: glutaredoxin domain-containing protein [Paenibacillus]MCK6075228.1 glutathione S-transferase N-terminal domain-containing protein [Paenibacillus silvae]MCK6149615.1 glutathione S-transferase N-terminal domain-containing protein [Paenibacillus silvae]MCK6267913.1 glutathione S-transferase N-terminal domain-containing protein [Paenibacillus silvae]